jgi:hypothetical protein
MKLMGRRFGSVERDEEQMRVPEAVQGKEARKPPLPPGHSDPSARIGRISGPSGRPRGRSSRTAAGSEEWRVVEFRNVSRVALLVPTRARAGMCECRDRERG